MNHPNLDPQHSPQWKEKEYQDPHFHDEDLEIQADDQERPSNRFLLKKKVDRRLPTRRRFFDD
jgi:hypothetical protein